MTTFPALSPAARVFTPGDYPHSKLKAYSGRQTRIRHSDAIVGQTVSFTFTGLDESDRDLIIDHYRTQAGAFALFETHADNWSGSTNPTPPGYRWAYAASPQIDDIGCGYHNVTVQLQMMPPQFGVALGAALSIRASITGGHASAGASIPGADLTMTVSMAAGAARAGANIPGASLTVTTSIEGGTASSP